MKRLFHILLLVSLCAVNSGLHAKYIDSGKNPFSYAAYTLVEPLENIKWKHWAAVYGWTIAVESSAASLSCVGLLYLNKNPLSIAFLFPALIACAASTNKLYHLVLDGTKDPAFAKTLTAALFIGSLIGPAIFMQKDFYSTKWTTWSKNNRYSISFSLSACALHYTEKALSSLKKLITFNPKSTLGSLLHT